MVTGTDKVSSSATESLEDWPRGGHMAWVGLTLLRVSVTHRPTHAPKVSQLLFQSVTSNRAIQLAKDGSGRNPRPSGGAAGAKQETFRAGDQSQPHQQLSSTCTREPKY